MDTTRNIMINRHKHLSCFLLPVLSFSFLVARRANTEPLFYKPPYMVRTSWYHTLKVPYPIHVKSKNSPYVIFTRSTGNLKKTSDATVKILSTENSSNPLNPSLSKSSSESDTLSKDTVPLPTEGLIQSQVDTLSEKTYSRSGSQTQPPCGDFKKIPPMTSMEDRYPGFFKTQSSNMSKNSTTTTEEKLPGTTTTTNTSVSEDTPKTNTGFGLGGAFSAHVIARDFHDKVSATNTTDPESSNDDGDRLLDIGGRSIFEEPPTVDTSKKDPFPPSTTDVQSSETNHDTSWATSSSENPEVISSREIYPKPYFQSEEFLAQLKKAVESRELRRESIEEAWQELQHKRDENDKSLRTLHKRSQEISVEVRDKRDALLQKAKSLGPLWTQEHKALLEELKSFLETEFTHIEEISGITPFSRDMLEACNLLNIYANTMSSEVLLAVQEFLLSFPPTTPFTLEQYKDAIAYNQKGKDLLDAYHSELPEGIFLEVVRRANVIKNNDAIVSDTIQHTYKQSEGFTINASVYEGKLMLHGELLTKEQQKEIRSNIEHKNYELITMSFKEDNKLIENTQERHQNILTTYTEKDNTQGWIIVGNATSSTDSNTIFIAPKQYLNENPAERNKIQRARIINNPIRITEKEKEERFHGKTSEEIAALIKTEQAFTEFYKSNDYNGIDIQGKLLAEIIKQYAEENSCTVRNPHVFDHDTLCEITRNAYIEKMQEYQTVYENKSIMMGSKDAKSKLKEEGSDQKNYSNRQEESKRTYEKSLLEYSDKKLLDTADDLKEKEKQHKKELSNKKKHDQNMANKSKHGGKNNT